MAEAKGSSDPSSSASNPADSSTVFLHPGSFCRTRSMTVNTNRAPSPLQCPLAGGYDRISSGMNTYEKRRGGPPTRPAMSKKRKAGGCEQSCGQSLAPLAPSPSRGRSRAAATQRRMQVLLLAGGGRRRLAGFQVGQQRDGGIARGGKLRLSTTTAKGPARRAVDTTGQEG